MSETSTGSHHDAGRYETRLPKHPDSRANERSTRPRVAAVMEVGCLVVAAFQAALTFGAPLDAAAMGGTNSGRLPDNLRFVTALTALAWLFVTLIVLARGGFAVSPLPRAVAKWGTWALVGTLGVATLLNIASSSPWERFGWGPFSLIMLILCIALARSGLTRGSTTPGRG